MSPWEAPELRDGFDHRGHQCNACGMHHCHMVVILPQGPHQGKIVDEPEYEGWSGAGWPSAVTGHRWRGVAQHPARSGLCRRQRVRLAIGWVMEGQEKGWITKEQLGFELKWGDIRGADQLFKMIASGRASAICWPRASSAPPRSWAGPRPRPPSTRCKGATPRGHDHRARWEEMLDTTTSSTATMETGNPVHQTELGMPARINPFDGVEVAKLVAGCAGAATSRTRSASASSPRGPGWRTSAARCRRRPAGPTRSRRPCAWGARRRRSTAPWRCAVG